MSIKKSRIKEGCTYVFMRPDHENHAKEVTVTSIQGADFKVVLTSKLCAALTSRTGSPKRNLTSFECTEDELW